MHLVFLLINVQWYSVLSLSAVEIETNLVLRRLFLAKQPIIHNNTINSYCTDSFE